MSGEFYVLPLCDHEILVSDFNTEWVRCRCGINYRESTLLAFKDALQQLSAASTRLDHIEFSARALDAQRNQELGYAPVAAAQVAAPSTISVPIATGVSASATAPAVAAAQPTFVPPPVQKKPARPKRELPKLSPQQTLLAVAGALIVIALSIFLGSTFSTIGAPGQSAVIAALVAASAFGSIKSKKYFTIISNFLAVLSALFLGAGLWAAAILGLFPISWASPIESPYVPAVILVVGTYSFFMGKRFSIFGFSALAAPAVASAVLVFSATYLANILANASSGRSLAGIAMLAVSVGAFATVLVGRLTLTSRLALSAEAKKLAKSSKKKTEEVAKSADEREADYQRDLLEREINALTGIYRASVVGSLSYLAIQTLFILQVLGAALLSPDLDIAATPEPISLLSLGLFWLLGAFAIERIGAKYTASGSVSPAVKNFAWITGFGFTAFSLSVLTATLQPAATSGVIEETNIFMLVLNGLIGAAFLFSVPKAFAESMPRSVLASQIAAYVAWVTFGLLTPWDANFNLYTSIWLGIIALSLLAKAWMTRTSVLAWIALGAGSVSSLLPIFDSKLDRSVGLYAVALSALCLALAFGWRFAVARVLDRAEVKSTAAVGWVHFATNLVITIATVGLWTAHRYIVSSNDTIEFWPILTLFALFALGSAVLATSSKSKLVESFSVSLAGVSATFLISGYMALTVAQGGENQSLVWGAYSLVAFAIVLFFAKRRGSEVAAFVSLLPATIAAVNFGQLIVEASESIQIITPLGFLGLAVAFTLVVKRIAKPTPVAFVPVALASFAVSGAFYGFAKSAATTEWMLDTNAQLNNAVWATVVFAAMSATALVLHTRESFTKDAFYSLYLRVTGVALLVATLQVASSVNGTTGSLWLSTAAVALAFALTWFVANAKSSQIWFIANLAAGISLVMVVQATVIGVFAPTTADAFFSSWLALLVPVSLAAAWLVYSAVLSLSAKRDVNFGWVGLPVASVIAALLAIFAAPLIGLYRTIALPSIDFTNPWPLALGFVGLAFAYGFIRVRAVKNADADRSLLAASVVSLVLGIVGLMPYGIEAGEFNLAVATVLAAHAAMNFWSSFVTKQAKTALYGFILGVGAAWIALGEAVAQFNLSFVQSFAFASTLLFVLTTVLFKRSSEKPSVETWSIALPITSAIGLAVGVAQIDLFAVRNEAVGWIELLVATAVGSAYLMLSRTKVLGGAGKAHLALIISAAVSWVFALWQAIFESPTRDLKLGLVTLAIGATLLVFAKLEKQLTALLVGAAALAVSGFAFGETIVKAIGGYEGPELHSTLIALTLVASTQVAIRIDKVIDRFKTLLTFGLPLLVVGLPSTIFNWSAVIEPLALQQTGDVARTLTLMIAGAALLTLGLRLGNLGLTLAGAAPLALTLLPSIWFRIDEYFDGKLEIEMKALFIGGLLFGIGYGLVAALKLKINSSIYVGLPILIAMAPALANTFGALNQATLTAEDWYRFGIILGGSLVFLVLGALRRLAGFFGPGAIGVLVAAVPYAWKPLSEQTWFVWVVLIIVAGLLVWMAIKLEQFKSNARSTSVWLKELR
jgi:hypothetical protein